MAAKLRASFYHVFSLFHNNPPVLLLSPKQASPSSPGKREQEARTKKAALRETIPSMTSEASYITNPYAAEGPALSPPPSYPVPPIPSEIPQGRRTPLRPPGLNLNGSPPSSADFLMQSMNFVPAASAYFASAAILAKKLLPGSDPLRLSVALEYCAFTWDCGKEYKAASDLARQTLRDVFKTQEGMDDADFEDATSLVQAIAVIAKRNETSPRSQSTPKSRLQNVPNASRTMSPAQRSSAKSSPSRQILANYQRRQLPSIPVPKAPSHTPEVEVGLSETEGRSITLVGSPNIGMEVRKNSSSGDSGPRSQTDNNGKQRPVYIRQGSSEKERKRSIVEKAEEEARRRSIAKGAGSGTASRQTTPPQMVGGTSVESKTRPRDGSQAV